MRVTVGGKETNTLSSQATIGCLVGFGLIWVAFSSIFVFFGLTQKIPGMLIMGSIFVLLGLAGLGYAGMIFYTRRRVGKPDLLISNTTLQIGEPFTIGYSHSFASTVEVTEIALRLVFKETATYQQGTDTRTVTHEHVVAEFVEPGHSFLPGQMINQSYEVQIPPDGMHTLKVRRNQLEWFVRFQMIIPRLPDFVEQRELTVLPAFYQ